MEIKDKHLFRRLFGYTRPYRKRYVVAVLIMILLIFCELLLPFLIGKTLKLLGEDEIRIKELLKILIAMLLSVGLMPSIAYLQIMILHKTGHKIIYDLRNDVLTHIQTLSHAQLNNIPVGTLVTRATSDVNVLFELYTNIMVDLLRNFVTIICVFGAMFILNAKLALLLSTVVPILGIASFIFRYCARKVHRKVRDNVSSMNAFLSENISGIKLTQVFNQEEQKKREFIENNNNLKKSTLEEVFVFGIFRPTIYVLYIISVIIVFRYGGKWAIEFNIGTGSIAITFDILFTFYQYISKFFNPIQTLADQFNELQSSFAAAEKIFSVLDTEPEIKDEPDAVDMKIEGDIEFQDVWFAYLPGEWVLKGVSFHIRPNETIAFVGATGSGKTTILSLIVRNYEIQRGRILIDGVDIKKIKLKSLRSQIGQMLQDVFLFEGSVLENIRMNDHLIAEEKAKQAAEYINASKFIEKLPHGYDEIARERGSNFSLGQRQLISFARTIVHQPKVMILDEATANIDTETEVLIQDSLEKIIKTGTIIIVAHRLSTIQHSDCIYVFNNGEIVEKGTHQELLKSAGRYYRLYRLQYTENQFSES